MRPVRRGEKGNGLSREEEGPQQGGTLAGKNRVYERPPAEERRGSIFVTRKGLPQYTIKGEMTRPKNGGMPFGRLLR